MRKDARRNRERIIQAAEQVLTQVPASATMPMIARTAGLSTATAYRFFPSLEDLHAAYLQAVIVRLRTFSHDCAARGLDLQKEVAEEWIRLVQLHGRGMVQVRSRQGFLTRLRSYDSLITTVRDAWERPIRAVMHNVGLREDQFDYALYLNNALFDPREILDLLDSGLTEAEVRDRLTDAYSGALMGWSRRL